MRLLCCSCSSTITAPPKLNASRRFPPKQIPTVRSISVATAESDVSAAIDPLLRRRLILLRHADSAAPARFLRDHDRPLSEAGRDEAASIAVKLQEMGWVPQLILSSDAARTKETLKIMQEHAHGFSEAKVYFMSSFYSIAAMDGQTADHLQKSICKYSTDDILTVMCMGHNRGWEEAASVFSGSPIELKTCNAALLEAIGKSWNEAFIVAGLGGWKLHGIVMPNSSP